jgi:hypothetical protein
MPTDRSTPQPDRPSFPTAAERRRTRSARFAVIDRMPIPTRSRARAVLIVRRADANLQRPMATAWAAAFARIRTDGQAMCERLRGPHQWSRDQVERRIDELEAALTRLERSLE